MCNNLACEMIKRKDLEKRTRKIFHEIHKTQGNNPTIYNRLLSLLNTDYLKVEENFFHGKICLDAGCGSNAYATRSMLKMGAKRVYAFDLDKTILETAPKFLNDFKGKYELSVGNILEMKYKNNFFDFCHCAGVLHHTANVFKGLKELARVTKIGGILYVSTYGKGGLLREITSFLRKKYQNDNEFKNLIDNLNEKDLVNLFKWVTSVMALHGDNIAKNIPLSLIKELFDKDLVLTIKDRITAPVYHENSEEELVNWLKNNGFSKIERLTRYPKYNNIRRFLSPLYFEYDSKYSRLLCGSGVVQIKAVKIKDTRHNQK